MDATYYQVSASLVLVVVFLDLRYVSWPIETLLKLIARKSTVHITLNIQNQSFSMRPEGYIVLILAFACGFLRSVESSDGATFGESTAIIEIMTGTYPGEQRWLLYKTDNLGSYTYAFAELVQSIHKSWL